MYRPTVVEVARVYCPTLAVAAVAMMDLAVIVNWQMAVIANLVHAQLTRYLQ